MNSTEQKILSLTDAARETGVSLQTIRKYIRLGKLEAGRRPNGRYAIARDDLLRFIGWFQGVEKQ